MGRMRRGHDQLAFGKGRSGKGRGGQRERCGPGSEVLNWRHLNLPLSFIFKVSKCFGHRVTGRNFLKRGDGRLATDSTCVIEEFHLPAPGVQRAGQDRQPELRTQKPPRVGMGGLFKDLRAAARFP